MTPQAPPMQGGDLYFLRLDTNFEHQRATWKNTTAVSNFNTDAANAEMNEEQSGKPAVNPAPAFLSWAIVDDALLAQLFARQIAFQPNGTYYNNAINLDDSMRVVKIPMPKGSRAAIKSDGTLQIIGAPQPPAPEMPASPVGPEEGAGYFEDVSPGHPFPDGYHLAMPEGTYVMEIHYSPFAPGDHKQYFWHLQPQVAPVPVPVAPAATDQSKLIAELEAEIAALKAKGVAV